jgi:hypothetical protein
MFNNDLPIKTGQNNAEDAEMKKQIVTGLIGAASLLAIMASGAYATDLTLSQYSKTCDKGVIKEIAAGYVTDNSWRLGTCRRVLTMTCDPTAGGALAGKTESYCVHSGFDPDGILATALTAQDSAKDVKYRVFTYSNPDNKFVNGLLLNLSLVTGQ